MNTLATLQDRFRTALAQIVDGDVEPLVAMITPAQDAKFGDYQANCAMPLKKRLNQPPREIAQQIIDLVELDDFCEKVEIAGPGFINLHLSTSWLASQVASLKDDDRLGVSTASAPRKYIVDFSSPNVAKPMHVGHIRSTVIGDALCRTLRFLGHEVVSDNHLGDWGTQFGMIIYGFRHFVDKAAYQTNPVPELSRVYREVRSILDFHETQAGLPQAKAAFTTLSDNLSAMERQAATGDAKADKKANKQISKLRADVEKQRESIALSEQKLATFLADPTAKEKIAKHANIADAVLQETAKLHAGDVENKKLWEEFLPKCRNEIDSIYRRLDVTFDEELGESAYHDQLAGVVQQLEARGLARVSEGAMCVFLDGYDAPMIVRKKDGAFLYATTDLATIEYRMKRWNPDAILYVVDFRQGDHFGKLFDVARAWGYEKVELTHVSFGTVLGEDGRPIKTRAGDTPPLESLLDQAVARVHKVVTENNPEFDDDRKNRIANVIGHAAIKYADLSQNRTSDYKFSFDKMASLNGNTATYLQYAYARIHGIFAKSNQDLAALRRSDVAILLDTIPERNLAKQLLRLEEALNEMVVDYRPNVLTNYLYQLAKSVAEFYGPCPVLKDGVPEELRLSRLLLCDIAARTMKLGLSLLGIQVVEKM